MKRHFFILLATLMLLTAAIWGFSFVVVKDSLNRIGAIWMLFYRFSIAAVALGIFPVIKRLIKKNASPHTNNFSNQDQNNIQKSSSSKIAPQANNTFSKTLLHGALLGVFLFTAYVLQTIGCKYTTAGKNAFFTAIYVFLVPIFSAIILHTRLKIRILLCAAISVAGLAMLSLGGGKRSAFNRGDFLTILCSIFFALHISYGGKWTQKDDPITLSVIQFAMAAILGLLLAPLIDGTQTEILSQLLDRRVIIAMLYLGIFSTMVGFALQNIGLKYLPSNVAALLLSTESLFGALFGVIILGEPMTILMAIGGGLMFLALALAQV